MNREPCLRALMLIENNAILKIRERTTYSFGFTETISQISHKVVL